MTSSEREAFLRAFHAARPAATSRALARTGIYERFAATVPRDGRILDLACGDGHLARMLGAIGVDVSSEPGPDVHARAQELPFADASFAAVSCHLAFMLFDEVEHVVAELARVLRPGGVFVALLGGGPTGDGDDAFHAFVQLLPRGGIAFGDPRAKSERGWQQLFAATRWSEPAFERVEVDASGTIDEVWTFLGSSYQLAAEDREAVRAALRARFPEPVVPCRIATYVARVIRR